MKKDNYKHFKPGDCVVCLKQGFVVHPEMFGDDDEESELVLFSPYIFKCYLENSEGHPLYDMLVLQEKPTYYDGKNFMLLSEFRKIKLDRLKRNLFYKKMFGKFGFVK
jgi:hypothetical protein